VVFTIIGSVSADDGATCSTDTSLDSIAPTIEGINPANNSVNVPANTVINVTFSEPIQEGNTTIELRNSTGALIPITTSISDNILTITPVSSLARGVEYTVLFNENSVKDLSGNGVEFYTSTFTVVPLMKAYWMWGSAVAGADVTDLSNKGITDLFVLTRGTTGKSYLNELQLAISKFQPAGIKVHAWIVCFKDSNGNFVDPSGYYSYTKKVYVKTIKYWGKKKVAYKVWKKVKWKKIGKRWKYKWIKVIRYRWRKGWIYQPVYSYVTEKGYSQNFNNYLVDYIKAITINYKVDGIHLDYVRYSGVASKNHAAYQEPGGEVAAINAVTGFVSRVNAAIKSIEPGILLSAAVMPECSTNAKYYGQDYTKLADYLDFFVPMAYEGNYNANDAWITSVTSYIVAQAKGKPVYSGLTTYWSDSDTRVLSNEELDADAQAAESGGADGFVLFRYGIGAYVPDWPA